MRNLELTLLGFWLSCKLSRNISITVTIKILFRLSTLSPKINLGSKKLGMSKFLDTVLKICRDFMFNIILAIPDYKTNVFPSKVSFYIH